MESNKDKEKKIIVDSINFLIKDNNYFDTFKTGIQHIFIRFKSEIQK